MKEDKFDTMYEDRFDALQKKYEAEIAIAKSELKTYFELGMGVAEHPHIIESMDLLMDKMANAQEKLDLLLKEF
jgi:hypothetical protein|tara:strand:- start:680 stop:901 length:222 start_codon:yes stop_codon:yes gene_type:complete